MSPSKPTPNVDLIIEALSQRPAAIAALLEQREEIDHKLGSLGYDPATEPLKPKRGRPAGSRNVRNRIPADIRAGLEELAREGHHVSKTSENRIDIFTAAERLGFARGESADEFLVGAARAIESEVQEANNATE